MFESPGKTWKRIIYELRTTWYFFNRTLTSTRSSLHVRASSFPSSHGAGIPEHLNHRLMTNFSGDVQRCRAAICRLVDVSARHDKRLHHRLVAI